MLSTRRRFRWPQRLLALFAVAIGVAGCTAAGGGSTITVSGTTLTIYASLPSTLPASQTADMLDAEKLALSQTGSKAGNFTIRFIPLYSSPSDNARKAIQDTSAIAYIGELAPGLSVDSMGITEDQDLLQVSPVDTAIAEAQSTPAVPGAPKSYNEEWKTFGRTFARVVPSGVAEARVQVAEMRALGVKKLYVTSDGSDYGKALAYAVAQDATPAGISVPAQGPPTAAGFSSSGADALFLGASSTDSGQAATLFDQVASGDHGVKLFAPSALDTSGFASSLATSSLNLYVTQPGFLPKDLPASAESQFVKPFEAAYGHAPATQSIFGYEAMSAILSVLTHASSSADDRVDVVKDFFALKDRASVLGTYSIDSQGDTSIAPFVINRFQKGAFVPVKFVQASP